MEGNRRVGALEDDRRVGALEGDRRVGAYLPNKIDPCFFLDAAVVVASALAEVICVSLLVVSGFAVVGSAVAEVNAVLWHCDAAIDSDW